MHSPQIDTTHTPSQHLIYRQPNSLHVTSADVLLSEDQCANFPWTARLYPKQTQIILFDQIYQRKPESAVYDKRAAGSSHTDSIQAFPRSTPTTDPSTHAFSPEHGSYA